MVEWLTKNKSKREATLYRHCLQWLSVQRLLQGLSKLKQRRSLTRR